jgi:hypothetical protein
MHCDLIQRTGRNILRFISESGTIELSMVEGTVRRFLASTRQWESRTLPQGYVYEQCYIDEIGLFLKAIEDTDQWHIPLPMAVDVVKFLMAMHQSAQTKSTVKIQG